MNPEMLCGSVNQFSELVGVLRAFGGSWLAPPLYNPNDSGDAQDEYRDARRQNNQPGRRQHNLVVSDMQSHRPNMLPESALFQVMGEYTPA